jgi:predicted dehydrogenase
MQTGMDTREARTDPALRWGFVGTGAIAGRMASTLEATPGATLAAVTSRRLDTAREFADRHGGAHAFDDWRQMLRSEHIDAVYIAIPTGLREVITLAAAETGRHVLCEKPFVNLASLRRITQACRHADVAFMDATHIVHHPRHRAILERLSEDIGSPRLLRTNFLLNLSNRCDIRYDTTLEPLGALGDLGWYNLRASLEYLAPGGTPAAIQASLRHDEATGAVISAQGTLRYEDGTESTWRCSFDAPTVDLCLELEGPRGRLRMDNFVGDDDGPVAYRYRAASALSADEDVIPVESRRSAAALMFEDFSRAVRDASLREGWMCASERTQALVDQVLEASRAATRP